MEVSRVDMISQWGVISASDVGGLLPLLVAYPLILPPSPMQCLPSSQEYDIAKSMAPCNLQILSCSQVNSLLLQLDIFCPSLGSCSYLCWLCFFSVDHFFHFAEIILNSPSAFKWFFLDPFESSTKWSSNTVLQQPEIDATSTSALQYWCTRAKPFPCYHFYCCWRTCCNFW